MKATMFTFEEFLDAKAEWDDTLHRSKDDNIFLTWEWLSTWWRHYGLKRRFLLVTVSNSRRMLAAAPLMFSSYKLHGLSLRKIEFVATPASDYHTFLLTEVKPEYVKMILECVARIETDWDCIEFQEIPHDSVTINILRNVSEGHLKFAERTQNLCPYILLPNDFEEYLQRLSYSFRKNLRRYERKLEKDYKVEFQICSDVDAIDNAMETFFDLHQRRWQSRNQPGAFCDQIFRDFHRHVARCLARRGWLALNLLMLNDEPVAAGYDFKYAGKLSYYLSGFDPQYSKYQVGHLRHLYLIKHCIENGLTEYDFMRGNESYKLKWNTSIRKNIEFTAIRKRLIPVAYSLIMKKRAFSPLTYELGKHLSVG